MNGILLSSIYSGSICVTIAVKEVIRNYIAMQRISPSLKTRDLIKTHNLSNRRRKTIVNKQSDKNPGYSSKDEERKSSTNRKFCKNDRKPPGQENKNNQKQ